MSRRRFTLAALGLLTTGIVARRARAEEATAPISVQAQILSRILPFERNFADRAKDSVVVVVLERSDAEAISACRQFQRAMETIGQVGGKPVIVKAQTHARAVNVGLTCKALGAYALYIPPTFGIDVPAIATSLIGSGVMSFAAVDAFVPLGAVLGVGINAGKPLMEINLAQARAQNVSLPASVLRLAKVY